MMHDQDRIRNIEADIAVANDAVTVLCAGRWVLDHLATLETRLQYFPWPDVPDLVIDVQALDALDSAGAWLIARTLQRLRDLGHNVTLRGLRAPHAALLDMVVARTELPTPTADMHPGILARVGCFAWTRLNHTVDFLAFVGECMVVLARSLENPARLRVRSLLGNLQTAGFDALPITGLLSFLMGVVIAYQGAEQLERYGANIFIADLVGLSMLRELSPLLTAIIVAGRSGSAYTAQIGTMKVTEEIDALRTIGIVPMELLVLPKLLALIIALPLLTVYTDMVGVFGGMVIAQSHLSVNFGDFLDRLGDAIDISDYLVGIGKAPVFAMIIALVGCYQGFRVGGSADSVGRQTTVSVVQAIFLVIVTDAAFSVAFSQLGI